MPDRDRLLHRTAELAGDFLDRLPDRPVAQKVDLVALREALGGPVPVAPSDLAAVQADGTCWLGGTTWHGMAAMRISVSNWSTTEADIDLCATAILRCAREIGS
jgi:hypothetical protein